MPPASEPVAAPAERRAIDAVIDPDPLHFLSCVKQFLAAHRVGNSMLIVLLHFWMTGEAPDTRRVGAYARDADGTVVGVAVNVVGVRAVLSSMPPDAVAVLEEALAEVDPDVPAVIGPIWPAALFAERRGARLGRAFRAGRRLGAYVIDGEPARPDVPGSPRQADESDLPLLTRWLNVFGSGDAFDSSSRAQNLLRHGQCFLWEVDREPVALTGFSDELLGVAHCGPSYTVPEHRGAGYGEAVWWVAREAAIARGAEVLVHWVNLDYGPTNRMIARIGGRAGGEEVREYTVAGE
jgi:GNAT superfamily N-acetyltransferase